ncbi:polymer-forming cytoskeletal protein [Chlorobaculum sp. 24CR]|uniref:bactofilin family protein n=1 Tax=Chlorobaculum sp. 24CR TaxID=2508878 RepID=UPI00100A7236|nr:polymer-forming cytoskeletal protein [Chlorobaculum sp. 24CR]RXK85121.1 polymer-forming cytoskeletal protein [Chlorobaculum sp. 24CR]
MRNNLFSIIKKDAHASPDSLPPSQENSIQTPAPDPVKNKPGIHSFQEKSSTNNHINAPTNTMNLIAKSAVLEGTLMIEGDLKVEGKIIGDIIANGNIMLEDGGFIEGNVKACALIVGGSFKGNAEISGECLVSSTGNVEGDLVINILNVNAGAHVTGNISMYEQQPEESTSIKTNNKARLAVSN